MANKMKKRADGRYQGKILVGVIDGKEKYRYVYGKDSKEVKDKLAELRVELGRGVDLMQDRALSCWIDRWLRRSESTQTYDWHALCETRLDFWRDRLGKADITSLTAADLEDVLFELAKRNPRTGKPSGKKTILEYKNVIKQVLDLAKKNRVITFNPAADVSVQKDAARSTRDAITNEQIALIRATPHEAQLPCLIMIYAGLRLGEVCALTWSDVNLNERTISINKSLNFKTYETKPPKTAAGIRTVPIPDILAEALAAAPRTSLLVCPHNGGPYTSRAWSHCFEKYLKELGFQTTAHCLRHTYCTILYESDVDVLTAKTWMGHADVTTTLRIYTHLREQKKDSAILKLNAYLSNSTEKKSLAK